MADEAPIVELSAIPDDSTVVFTVEHTATGETDEGILLVQEGTPFAWRNCCQHQRHVRLDDGDGAVLRDGEIVCTRHGATFRAAEGTCTYGPCAGATLESIGVTVRNGMVLLTDDSWSFLELGPSGSGTTARSTTGAPEF